MKARVYFPYMACLPPIRQYRCIGFEEAGKVIDILEVTWVCWIEVVPPGLYSCPLYAVLCALGCVGQAGWWPGGGQRLLIDG